MMKDLKKKLKTIRPNLKNRLEIIKSIKLPKSNTVLSYLQDKLEKSVKSNHNEVLLKQSPNWAKSITWSLIGGTTLGIAWLVVGQTEEIVVVQGKLETINQVHELQIAGGAIIDEIFIKEGEFVKKDQLLLTFNSESTRNNVKTIEERLILNKNILEKYRYLKAEGAVSELQYLEQKNNVNTIRNELDNQKILLENQKLLAPSDGKIFDLQPTNNGYLTRTNEPVLKVVPNDKLKAKVEIESRSIGFVSEGKKVDVSIDSFPATDFGVIKGKVTSIGSDALAPDPMNGKGYRFPATITLNRQSLITKDKKSLKLQPGMSITANIKLRKVSYLNLLLNTFQDKADSLRTL